jgi:hypothetical protein
VVRATLNALLPLVSGRPETANSILDTTKNYSGEPELRLSGGNAQGLLSS